MARGPLAPGRCAGACGHVLDHTVQLLPQFPQRHRRELRCAHDGPLDLRSRDLKVAPRRGQPDPHHAAVRGLPRAGEQSSPIHPREKGAQGVAGKGQAGGDVVDRLPIVLPEHEHHQVLRVGQPDLRQQRTVGTGHRTQATYKAKHS